VSPFYRDIIYPSAKRLIDIFAAVFGILIFSPLMVLIWIARKLEGATRVIFSQTRIGRNGKTFKFHKFSSMTTTTDEEEQEFFIQLEKNDPRLLEEYKRSDFKFKNGNDPRITKVGKFIRRFSVDELPQFLNVLKGEMSLVGPRAYKPDELEYKLKEYPQSRKDVETLLKVKPGITGVWQVSGRSEVDFPKRAQLDSGYARRSSLIEDFLIIIKTPFAMIIGKGAY
jgi:lipopolysaccharide/colanic/teichoic acid biosynthesis glycosyltransferase